MSTTVSMATPALVAGMFAILLLAIAGGLVAYALARRRRQSLALLALAARRLREDDLFSPVPVVADPSLAPLAAALEHARASLQAQLRAAGTDDARERALIGALREPVVTTSPDWRIMAFNASAEAAFGKLGRVYGRPIQEILPFVEPGAADGDQPGKYEGKITDAAGRTLDVEVTCTSLMEGRLPARCVYIVHDVSQYAELNRLREQLLYSVAHELRGSLGVLDTSLEIAATEYADLDGQVFDGLMDTARRTTRRVRTLMEDLLNAGSIQSGRFVVRPQPTALAAIVDDALEVVAPIIGAGRVQGRLPDGDSLDVLADRRYVRHVLTNLLTNAAKYGPAEGAILLRADRFDGEVRVTVEDRGPGIAAEQQARIFEPYFRVRNRQDTPGVGLGLAIAKGIVDAHGGRMGLDSALGDGTRIWFTLPAAASSPLAATAALPETASPPEGAAL